MRKNTDRIGTTIINQYGDKMVCVDYIDNHNIIVEIQNSNKTQIRTYWRAFINNKIDLTKIKRLGEERYNQDGQLMKVVEYNKYSDIVVEFQDKYKYRTHTRYDAFKEGKVENKFVVKICDVETYNTGKNINSKEYTEVTLAMLENLDNGTEVTVDSLLELGLIRKANDGIVVLGNGELTKKLTVKAARVTKTANEKITAAGGKVEVV